MLNKANLLVTEFASKEESRYTMQAIQVTPEATIATNGYYLAWVSTSRMSPENFPVVEGFDGGQKDFQPFLLDLGSAKQISKALPKNTTIPVLGFAAIHTTEDGDGKVHPQICVADLERPQVFHPKVPDGKFPNYQAIMPKIEDEMFSIALDADYLVTIAKAFAAFVPGKGRRVVLRFYKPDEAVRLDATNGEQGMTVVLMSMRNDDPDPFATYGYAERQAKREADAKARKEKEDAEAEEDANAELQTEEHPEQS